MRIRTFCHFALLAILLPLFRAVPAQAQGDQALAQVADGINPSDGTQFITKFRITNLGPYQDTEIKKLKIMFFLPNGSPWTIATNLGSAPASEFPLDLGAYQTVAINTSGTSSTLTSGYAIVRNTDAQTIYAEDYQVAVTAFYEVRKGGVVIDTISVPVSQPTVSFVFPVEIDDPNLYTGFAIVNLSDSTSGVSMQLFRATTPSSGGATQSGTTQNITLNPKEQKVGFLYPTFFPGVASFKGMLVGKSDKPVAILALLQTGTPTGVLYTTLVPAYIDALRRNSYMYLHLGNSLDADHLVSDYFFDQSLIQDTQYYELDVVLPWTLLFQKQSDTTRRLTPQFPVANGNRNSGAQVAVIGLKQDSDFDNLTIQDLQGLTYTSNPIDMSDNSSNLAPTFAFAIKTGLGHYVKVRISAVITRAPDKDLALEVFVFK